MLKFHTAFIIYTRMIVSGLLHEPSGIPRDNISKSLSEYKSLQLKGRVKAGCLNR